jgi:hypothetical protein
MRGHITYQPAETTWVCNARVYAQDDLFIVVEIRDENGAVLTARLSGQEVAEVEKAVRSLRAARRRLRAV